LSTAIPPTPDAALAAPPPSHVEETPLEALASICSVIVVAMFVFAFIFQNFEIPSASMEKTLLIGDHVVVDRTTLAPATSWAPFVHYRPVKRGDVIVFMKPNPETPDLILVKRCIGLPGDRIHLRHGVVFINGVAQKEPYAIQPTDSSYYAADANPNDDDAPGPYDPSRDDFPSDQ
jgi:signal peptidase I